MREYPRPLARYGRGPLDQGQRMYLDYSRSAVRKTGLLRWVRALWSHQVRLELARTISLLQALGVLGAMSVLGAALSLTPQLLQATLARWGSGSVLIRNFWQQELLHGGLALARHTLLFAPLFFGVLVGGLVLLAGLCARLGRNGRSWPHCFAILAVGAMPLLWFFMLFQIEGVSPQGAGLWWNPVTNLPRFAMLMLAVVLLALWAVDSRRLYLALRG